MGPAMIRKVREDYIAVIVVNKRVGMMVVEMPRQSICGVPRLQPVTAQSSLGREETERDMKGDLKLEVGI
jgi:hypothetical protein